MKARTEWTAHSVGERECVGEVGEGATPNGTSAVVGLVGACWPCLSLVNGLLSTWYQ